MEVILVKKRMFIIGMVAALLGASLSAVGMPFMATSAAAARFVPTSVKSAPSAGYLRQGLNLAGRAAKATALMGLNLTGRVAKVTASAGFSGLKFVGRNAKNFASYAVTQHPYISSAALATVLAYKYSRRCRIALARTGYGLSAAAMYVSHLLHNFWENQLEADGEFGDLLHQERWSQQEAQREREREEEDAQRQERENQEFIRNLHENRARQELDRQERQELDHQELDRQERLLLDQEAQQQNLQRRQREIQEFEAFAEAWQQVLEEHGILRPVQPAASVVNHPENPTNRPIPTMVHASDECAICFESAQSIPQDRLSVTNCCGQFLCQDCVDNLGRTASELHRNPPWDGHVYRPLAKCPYCNHYPLRTTAVTVQPDEGGEPTAIPTAIPAATPAASPESTAVLPPQDCLVQ
jgi:hypothetical protein